MKKYIPVADLGIIGLKSAEQMSEKIDKYISNWKNDFKRQDFNLMEKSYKKIEKEIKNLIPLEKTLTEARIIENLHNLIKNNGQNFNLTEEQLQLSEKLIYI